MLKAPLTIVIFVCCRNDAVRVVNSSFDFFYWLHYRIFNNIVNIVLMEEFQLNQPTVDFIWQTIINIVNYDQLQNMMDFMQITLLIIIWIIAQWNPNVNYQQLFFNFFSTFYQLYSQITLWQSIPQLASFWLIITEILGDFFFWRNVTDVFSSIFSVYAEFRLYTWVLRTFMYQKYFKKLKVFISVTISFLSDTFVSENSSKIE